MIERAFLALLVAYGVGLIAGGVILIQRAFIAWTS